MARPDWVDPYWEAKRGGRLAIADYRTATRDAISQAESARERATRHYSDIWGDIDRKIRQSAVDRGIYWSDMPSKAAFTAARNLRRDMLDVEQPYTEAITRASEGLARYGRQQGERTALRFADLMRDKRKMDELMRAGRFREALDMWIAQNQVAQAWEKGAPVAEPRAFRGAYSWLGRTPYTSWITGTGYKSGTGPPLGDPLFVVPRGKPQRTRAQAETQADRAERARQFDAGQALQREKMALAKYGGFETEQEYLDFLTKLEAIKGSPEMDELYAHTMRDLLNPAVVDPKTGEAQTDKFGQVIYKGSPEDFVLLARLTGTPIEKMYEDLPDRMRASVRSYLAAQEGRGIGRVSTVPGRASGAGQQVRPGWLESAPAGWTPSILSPFPFGPRVLEQNRPQEAYLEWLQSNPQSPFG